jgi:hypothetical protein
MIGLPANFTARTGSPLRRASLTAASSRKRPKAAWRPIRRRRADAPSGCRHADIVALRLSYSWPRLAGDPDLDAPVLGLTERRVVAGDWCHVRHPTRAPPGDRDTGFLEFGSYALGALGGEIAIG